jgi:hypothetical protein
MGVVYLAEHRLMDRRVAVKVLDPGLFAQPEAVSRFHAEVKAAARLDHPNIVRAYDAEQAGRLHLLVMECVPGVSLAHLLGQQGPLPVRLACRLVSQAALGLQHAFERGMVHRDVKPANLMVTRKGQLKILDFGLARLVSERKAGGLTHANVLMGTPEYIAPEQAVDARSADVRADLYSLGCTLYALLAGRPPFVKDTAVAVALAHIEEAPTPLIQVRPDVPEALSALVDRLLEKDLARRFQTPAEVAQALLPFCKGQKEAAPGAAPAGPWSADPFAELETSPGQDGAALARGPRKRLGRLIALALAAVVAGVVVAGALVVALRTPEGTLEVEVNEPDARVLVDGKEQSVSVLEGGKKLVFTVRPGTRQLEVVKDDFKAHAEEITVTRGKNKTIRARLIPIPPPAPPVTEYEWRGRRPQTRALPADEGFCVLSSIGGGFWSRAEKVWVRIGADGHWEVGGATPRRDGVFVKALPVRTAGRVVLSEHRWEPGRAPVKMLHRDEGFCFLAGVEGDFLGRGESIEVFIDKDGFWYLHGRSARPVAGRAISVRTADRLQVEEYTWTPTKWPVRMIKTEEGFCCLSGVAGAYRGAGELVRITVRDGYWYLEGKSLQSSLSVKAISVKGLKRK